jgi:hypothetical protein
MEKFLTMTWPGIRYTIEFILLPIVISLLSVWLDQLWHASREFGKAYAKAKSYAIGVVEHPDKVTLDHLYIASLAELQYVCSITGRDYDQVVMQLQNEVAVLNLKEELK